MLDDEMYKMQNMTGLNFCHQIRSKAMKIQPLQKYIFVESPENFYDMVMKYNDDYKMLVITRKAATEDINAAKSSHFPTADPVSSYAE